MSSSSAPKPIRLQIVKPAPSRERCILQGLTGGSTIFDVQTLISLQLNVPISSQILYSGFPSKLLTLPDSEAERKKVALTDIGIKNGDTIEVREKEVEEQKKWSGAEEMKQGSGWEYISTIPIQGGYFEKKTMPRDNSCLFHSIYHLLVINAASSSSSSSSIKSPFALRELIANMVACDPTKYNTVFLGSPNELYQQHILNENTWGGAVEINIFSQHFQAEIIAFDATYLREDVYGEGLGYSRRVFLLYSGDHYDALVYRVSNASTEEKKIFSVKDQHAWARARDYIEELHQEAVKSGTATLQKEWRSNSHIKKRNVLDEEKNRLKKVQEDQAKLKQTTIDASQIDLSAFQVDNASPPSNTTTSISANTQTAPAASWTCSVCTLINPRALTKCSACETPSPFNNSPTTTSNPVVATPDRPANRPNPSANGSSDYQCSVCTLANPIQLSSCAACQTPNPFYVPLSPTPSASTSTPARPAVDLDGVRAPDAQRSERLIDDGFQPLPSFFPMPRLTPQQQAALNNPFNCASCTAYNPPQSIECSACGRPNPGFLPPAAASSSSQSSTTNSGAPATGIGAKFRSVFGGSAPPWKCEVCGTSQTATLLRCKACKNPNMGLIEAQRKAGTDGCIIM